MSTIIVIAICIIVLFSLAFFTKRRFGTLGLALAAGATLSNLWTSDITPLIAQSGVQLVAPPLNTVVAALIVLLPPILLFFSGPKYSKLPQRVIGAGAFALLALAFILGPLGNAVVMDGQGKQFYEMIYDNREYIITAGLLFALFDILTIKKPKVDKLKH